MLHAFVFAMLVLTAMGRGSLLQSSSIKDDDRLSRALETISQTSPEGWKIIQKVQGMKPEVNEIASAKLLSDIVHDYAFNKGVYNISVKCQDIVYTI